MELRLLGVVRRTMVLWFLAWWNSSKMQARHSTSCSSAQWLQSRQGGREGGGEGGRRDADIRLERPWDTINHIVLLEESCVGHDEHLDGADADGADGLLLVLGVAEVHHCHDHHHPEAQG